MKLFLSAFRHAHSMILLSSIVVTTASAQQPASSVEDVVSAHKKFQVSINSLDNKKFNDELVNHLNETDTKGALGTALINALSSSFIQKTSNASSNLIDLGVSYVSEWFKTGTNKSSFKNWYSTINGMNNYKRKISSNEQIDDFYYNTSENGALDPTDMKFNGFVFRNFIEADKPAGMVDSKDRNAGAWKDASRGAENGQSRQGADKTNDKHIKETAEGKEICYLKCSLRTDSLGFAHITNHSKFYLQIDTLMFNPKYCNLPNDSTKQMGRQCASADTFSFDTRKNLQVELNVKVYSSWVNEAILYTIDQKLGEFTINATINRQDLTCVGKDSLFIYSCNSRTPHLDSLVSITGESFMVPRSFVGSVDRHVWGTGQYRLDIELSERCSLNEDYYMEIEHVGNTEQASYASLPGNRKWKKDVWKEEWRQMKSRRKDDSVWKNVGEAITTAYVGSNWVKEIVDPIATTLIQEETTTLNGLFDLGSVQSSGNMAGSKNSGAASQQPTKENGLGTPDVQNQQDAGGQNPPTDMSIMSGDGMR